MCVCIERNNDARVDTLVCIRVVGEEVAISEGEGKRHFVCACPITVQVHKDIGVCLHQTCLKSCLKIMPRM